MKIIFCITILFTIYFTQNNAQTTNSSDFIFPLDIEPSVSGSFAELRSNHFHSGIDLSTNGKTGLGVKCMADGIISRIKISPVGYGNAVYVKHNNGYTSVYAHLKSYAPKIDSVITREQYKIEQFSIDYFPTDSIYVKKGETIAYSGNSGSSGGPHLHYEIRDSNTEEPLNPFFFTSNIKDNVRPKLLTIRIYPLDSDSKVNGNSSAKNYPIVFYDGKFHLKGNPTIYATGNIGIGIEMLDYMSGSWKKCGVYSLIMNVNNKTTYEWDLDRFSFYESRYINAHIDYGYKAEHGKRFQRCYKLPNNNLSIYKNVVNNGIIVMDSTKQIQILAFDAAHNFSELDFKLKKGKSPAISMAPKEQQAFLKYNVDNHIKGNAVSCFIPKGTFYEDEFFLINEKIIDHKILYVVGNKSIPLQKNITLKFDIPDSLMSYNHSLCMASVNGNNKSYYAGGYIENGKMILKTRNTGNFTFHIDKIKPHIKSINYYNNKVYSRTSKLIFKISDNFSGIKSFNGYLNNQWTLFEYDAKSHTLCCPLRKAPKNINGTIDLKIVIEDNCSNELTYNGIFTIKN